MSNINMNFNKTNFPERVPATFWERITARKKRYKKDIVRMFDEHAKREKLEIPLRDYLLYAKRRMDREKTPLTDRVIFLGKKTWPKQYKAGIKTLAGFRIIWRDGHV